MTTTTTTTNNTSATTKPNYNNNEHIGFENALATVKQGEKVDIISLRKTRVFAKLMLKKGTKLADRQIQVSSTGKMYKATCFIIGPKKQIIEVDKLFINVNKDAIFRENSSMIYAELIHPKFEEGNVIELN